MSTTPPVVNYRPGQFLFHENEPSTFLLLVLKGTVAIRKVKGSGYIEIARIYEKEVVGELAFFDRLPRSASAVALTEVEAMKFSFESLDKAYEKTPEYFRTIMASVAERLRRADNMIRSLQKNLVTESGEAMPAPGQISAADALKAVSQLDESKDTGRKPE